eukprot:8019062-Alexandrium_andersonii.AAC.1
MPIPTAKYAVQGRIFVQYLTAGMPGKPPNTTSAYAAQTFSKDSARELQQPRLQWCTKFAPRQSQGSTRTKRFARALRVSSCFERTSYNRSSTPLMYRSSRNCSA